MKHDQTKSFSPAAHRKLESINKRTSEEKSANEIYWKGSDILYNDNGHDIKPRSLKSIRQIVHEVTVLKVAGYSEEDIRKNVTALESSARAPKK